MGVRISNSNNMTALYKLGNKIITKCFNILLDIHLTDVCSGMYMLRSELAREIDLETSGFEVEAEIAAQVASIGTITEVTLNYRPRVGRQELYRHGNTASK